MAMRPRLISVTAVLLLALATARANNLGNVTSLRIFKGLDGKQYIEIGHSGADLQTTANSDFKGAGTTENAPILIPWPSDETTCMSTWSILQKALACQCIRFFAISGYAAPKGSITREASAPVVVAEYRFLGQ